MKIGLKQKYNYSVFSSSGSLVHLYNVNLCLLIWNTCRSLYNISSRRNGTASCVLSCTEYLLFAEPVLKMTYIIVEDLENYKLSEYQVTETITDQASLYWGY